MHCVRPFRGASPRVCINLWFESNNVGLFPVPLPPGYGCDAQVAKIVAILRQNPAELRAFCKMWYRETIVASFHEAFEPSACLDAAMELHIEEAKEVEARVSTATLALLRAALPLKQAEESEAEEDLAEPLEQAEESEA